MAGYYDRRYVAPNITVSVAGKVDWPAFVELVEKHCGAWPTGKAPRDNVFPAKANPRMQTMKKETVTQEHVLLISPAPSGNDKLRHAADVLSMILGDSTRQPALLGHRRPRPRRNADVSFHDYHGTGGFFTSYSCDPENAEEVLACIGAIFAAVQKTSVTADELATAKSKVLSRVVRGSERPMGRMQALGMAWTYLGKYLSVDDELQAFEAVDLKAIREVLDQYPLTSPAIAALGPMEELRNSFSV